MKINKISFLLFLIYIFVGRQSLAQTCPDENISLNSQEDIDNFASNWPGCTEFDFDISIHHSNNTIDTIQNLNGLIQIKK